MIRKALFFALVAAAAARAEPPSGSPVPAARPDPSISAETSPEHAPAIPADAPSNSEGSPGVRTQLAESEEELERCLVRLDTFGAKYARVDPVLDEGEDCGILNPVQLTAPSPGVVLSTPAVLRCATALAVATWTARHLQPAADALGRGALTRLETGPGYQCRGRNGDPTADLSEHSFGNALDVLAFHFAAGDPVIVEPRQDDHTLAGAFQQTARSSSCLFFTTVLGPGTNAAHANHLHLDIKERRGGYRLCE